MKKDYVSFLIQCDDQLNILNSFWYQPAFLLSPYSTKFDSLFLEGDRKRLIKLIHDVLVNNDILICSDTFTLSTPEIDVTLCMMSSDGKVLIQGLDSSLAINDSSLYIIKDIIHRFLMVIKDTDNDILLNNSTMIRNQFEQIQKLNNNLINTQRQLKKANARLKQLNDNLNNRLVKDALTGLVSRYQYREEIELAINKSPDKQGIFTFIDIDDFKEVNDTYGHGVGDEYLKEFANRLTHLNFNNLISMRISGDEFGLYVHGYDKVTDKDIEDIWREILDKVVSRPIVIESLQREILCSSGMSIFGGDTTDIYDLIQYADFAMYEAKNSGKNSYRRFSMERYLNKNTSIL